MRNYSFRFRVFKLESRRMFTNTNVSLNNNGFTHYKGYVLKNQDLNESGTYYY